MTFTLHHGKQHVKLTLEPNEDIFGLDTVVHQLDVDGNTISKEPLDRLSYKVFRGSSWVNVEGDWIYVGWARIFVYQDGPEPLFDGAFALRGDSHHIQLRSHYVSTRHPLEPEVAGDSEFMIVTRDSDIMSDLQYQSKRSEILEARGVHCPADQLAFNTHPDHPIHRQFSGNLTESESTTSVWGSFGLDSMFNNGIRRRQIDSGVTSSGGFSGGVNLRNSIGNTAGCPSTKKVALFGIVADCTYVKSFNSSQTARQNIFSVINSAYVFLLALTLLNRDTNGFIDRIYMSEHSTSHLDSVT